MSSLSATTLGRSVKKEERVKVVALGCFIAVAIGGYVAFRSTMTGNPLMPFQTLARDLVLADRATFTTLTERILELEAIRARTGRWPEPAAAVGLPRVGLGADGRTAPTYSWQRSERGIIVNYLARPARGDSSAAWLVVYREPDPSTPADTAPNDEEHHRLPDGTVLHVSIWMRRFGAQVSADFLPQPEVAGWTQVLTAPDKGRSSR
jgi:hypothetical protein